MKVENDRSSSSIPVVESKKLQMVKTEIHKETGNRDMGAVHGRNKEELLNKVKTLNEFLAPMNTSLHYEFHEKLERYYVQIIDDKSQKVIREIPNKKFLDMYAAMSELIGIVVDEKI